MVEDGEAHVRLTQVEGRYVLLRTRDMDGLAVKLRAATTGAVSATLDLGKVAIFGLNKPLIVVETMRKEDDVVVG